MLHPTVLYELARIRMAEDLRRAEQERRFRQVAEGSRHHAIDSVPLRSRVARLLGFGGGPLRPAAAGA